MTLLTPRRANFQSGLPSTRRSGCRGKAPWSWSDFSISYESTSADASLCFHLRGRLPDLSPTQPDELMMQRELLKPILFSSHASLSTMVSYRYSMILPKVLLLKSAPRFSSLLGNSLAIHMRPGYSSGGYQAWHDHTPSIHMCNDTWPKGNCWCEQMLPRACSEACVLIYHRQRMWNASRYVIFYLM